MAPDEMNFLMETTSWKLLEGIWAVNDKPMPPSGSVVAHITDIHIYPNDDKEWFENLFCGHYSRKYEVMTKYIIWTVNELIKSINA